MWNRLFKGKSSKDGTSKKKKLGNFMRGSNSNSSTAKTCDSKVCDSDDVIDPVPENVELIPCQICSRTFTPSALEKHVGICEKMHIQKRTPFDSFRQRREGTTLETYLPSNYGLIAKPKTSKLSPTDTKSVSGSISSVYDASKKVPIRRVTPTRSEAPKLASQETPSQRRSIRVKPNPINEVCPHCGRSFGSRAFDRHVDWCAEKSKINQPSLSAQQHLAKERMQARTKYKAPTLRSKRDKNREKYSSLSESMNNLSDSGAVSIMDFNSVADPYERGRKSSIMSLSMTSSIASDGGFSDKYDPFISAKRQLEDLFNPSGMATSTPNKNLQRPAGFEMTKSLNAKSPSSPTKTPILSKSNFRRTSSLRVPSKKTPSPISFMPKYKPTIQRGISDEGPISSNFMKPEEFDELPVKSHAVIPPDLVPKSPKLPVRESPVQSPIVMKRPSANSAKRRMPCNAELKQNTGDFPLTKTDSLAAFLKFENELESTTSFDEKLSEKDLKDKSNNLNKKSSLSELIDNNKMTNESSEFGGERLPAIDLRLQQNNPIKLAPIEKPLIKHKIVLEPLNANPIECNNNINNHNNNNNNHHHHHIRIDENDNSIDSDLINSCDNLRISNLSKLHNETSTFEQSNDGVSGVTDAEIENHLVTNKSDSNHSTRDSSSADSIVTHQHLEHIANLKNINDTDKRNPKRQLQLHKDNLLFDNAITIGSTADDINEIQRVIEPDLKDSHKKMHSSNESSPKSQRTISSATSSSSSSSSSSSNNVDDRNDMHRKVSTKNQQVTELQDIDSLFEDFDLEEFISSFSDNEQFPIFKNYKQMVSTGRLTGRTQHGSESTSEESEFDDKFDVNDFDVNERERERASSTNSSIDHEKSNRFNILEVKPKHRLYDEKLLKKPDVTVEADKRMQIDSERGHKRYTTDTKLGQLQEILDESGEMSQAERELLESVQELNSMCDDSSSLDLTSGVSTPKDEIPAPMEASFKSLFLRSPIEMVNNGTTRFNQRNRHQPILSYQMPEIVGFSPSNKNRDIGRFKTPPLEHLTLKTDSNKLLTNNIDSKTSSPSNGFDRILPPINSPIIHKNDSQNIYNTINMASSYHDGSIGNRSSDSSLSNSASERKMSASMCVKSKDASNYNSLKSTKFCHECGAKFIVDHARFCMDCGVKRAVLD